MSKSPNAYYLFHLEVQAQHKGKSRAEIDQIAGALWNRMPESQKQVYKDRARQLKGDKGKMNSHGISLSAIEKKLAEEEAFVAKETEYIDYILAEGEKDGNLVDHEFKLINTNYYCIVNDIYLTCEVAVVPFSLRNGVGEAKHFLIKNQKGIPTGYTLEATNSCREHGVPLPPLRDGVIEDLEVASWILDFKKPLFTLPSKQRQVQNYIKQLLEMMGSDETVRVYSLTKLFFKLRNIFIEDADLGFPQISIAQMHLDKDPCIYYKGNSCEMHEDGELYYMCALGICKRWVYIICHHCCESAGIQQISGKHAHPMIDVESTSKSVSIKQECEDDEPFYRPHSPPKNVMEQGNWPGLGAGPSNPVQSPWVVHKPHQSEPANQWKKQGKRH